MSLYAYSFLTGSGTARAEGHTADPGKASEYAEAASEQTSLIVFTSDLGAPGVILAAYEYGQEIPVERAYAVAKNGYGLAAANPQDYTNSLPATPSREERP